MKQPSHLALRDGQGPLDVDWLVGEAARVSNEGRWGDADELGTWNCVTDEKRRQAAALVRRGAVFSLALEIGPDLPVAPGRPAPVHFLTLTGTDVAAAGREDPPQVSFADDWITMNLSCGTQWDGFAHVFSRGTTYNGVRAQAVSARAGAERCSVSAIAPAAVTRAVLLDVARADDRRWLDPGEAVTPDVLDAVASEHDVSVGPGDVVLVRTGAIAKARAEGEWAGYAGMSPQPGLHVTAGAWLAARDVAAVASDTWALEVIPYSVRGTAAPLHQLLLSRCGITIGEMFDLDALADDCAADGVYEMMLSAPPLPVAGAVSAPVPALAVK